MQGAGQISARLDVVVGFTKRSVDASAPQRRRAPIPADRTAGPADDWGGVRRADPPCARTETTWPGRRARGRALRGRAVLVALLEEARHRAKELPSEPRKAEITEPDRPLVREQHVGRGDVAVHHAQGCAIGPGGAVGIVQRRSDLPGDAQREVHRDRLTPPARRREQHGQIDPVHTVHDEPGLAVQQVEPAYSDERRYDGRGGSHERATDVVQVIGPGVEVGGWIGAGATGTVYAGRWTGRGAALDVAVKLARGGADVLREARAVGRLDHPNIVAVLDCGRTTVPWDEFEAGTSYVVLQRVEGENMTGWAGVGDALAIAAVGAVLAGLAHAHARGALHGDISPGNVIALPDGSRFWLTDFGGAGTEGFVAPERGAGPTVASDLYSVGALGRFLLGCEDARLAGLLSEDPSKRPRSAAEALAHLAMSWPFEAPPAPAPESQGWSDDRFGR